MGCFRFCTEEDLAQMMSALSAPARTEEDLAQMTSALNIPVTVNSSYNGIMEKLLRHEVVDLTNTTGRGAWGRFAHAVWAEAFVQAHPDAQTEVSIVKGGPQAGGRGRVDIVYEHFVMDWKTDNFDAPRYASERELDTRLDKIADQIESYVKSSSEAMRAAEVGIVYFEFPPSDSVRCAHIEDVLGERGIGVIWGPKY